MRNADPVPAFDFDAVVLLKIKKFNILFFCLAWTTSGWSARIEALPGKPGHRTVFFRTVL
jgi:hypothetical protein